jgi:TatD family-associated radical SAM protein
MEEEKQRGQNMQEGGNGQGRRRRKKHRGGKKNRPEQSGQPVQNAASVQSGKGGNAQKQPQNQPKPQPQKQNNPQNNGQNNKQKKGQNGGQKPQNKDDNRPDTYAYVLDGNLYLNLTNKCSNGCDFCVRNERTSYYGNYLWLRHGEPTVDKVIRAVNGMGDLKRFKEVVFCGFGEPTYKLAEMLELCDYFHGKGLKTRLNTNGQGSLIHKRDIAPDLVGKVDFVNISLNASCKEKYQKICRSQFGEAGFDGLTEFAKACKREGVACRFSIVDCIGEEEVEACKRLADSVKIPLYVRSYITDS